jgi:hypothetical protein
LEKISSYSEKTLELMLSDENNQEDSRLLNLLEEGKGSEYLGKIEKKENKSLKEALVLRLLNSEGLNSILKQEQEIKID